MVGRSKVGTMMLGLVATEQREDAWHALKVRVVSNTGGKRGRTQDEWWVVYHSQMMGYCRRLIQSHGGEGNSWNFPKSSNNHTVSHSRMACLIPTGMRRYVKLCMLALFLQTLAILSRPSRFQTELPDIFWDYRDKCAEKMSLQLCGQVIQKYQEFGEGGILFDDNESINIPPSRLSNRMEGSLSSAAWRTLNLVWAFGHCAESPVGRYIPKPRSFFGRKAAIKKSRTYPNEARSLELVTVGTQPEIWGRIHIYIHGLFQKHDWRTCPFQLHEGLNFRCGICFFQ